MDHMYSNTNQNQNKNKNYQQHSSSARRGGGSSNPIPISMMDAEQGRKPPPRHLSSWRHEDEEKRTPLAMAPGVAVEEDIAVVDSSSSVGAVAAVSGAVSCRHDEIMSFDSQAGHTSWEDRPGAVAIQPGGGMQVLQKARLSDGTAQPYYPSSLLIHQSSRVVVQDVGASPTEGGGGDHHHHHHHPIEPSFEVEVDENDVDHQYHKIRLPPLAPSSPPRKAFICNTDDGQERNVLLNYMRNILDKINCCCCCFRNNNDNNKKKKQLVYTGLAILLVLSVGIGVAVATAGGGDGGDSIQDYSDDSSSSSSDNNNDPIEMMIMDRSILIHELSYLSSNASSAVVLLNNPITPHGQALNWLIEDRRIRQEKEDEEDTINSSSSSSRSSSSSSSDITQVDTIRYSLSLLYYSTIKSNEKKWKESFNFLSHTHHECDWMGISCNLNHEIIGINLAYNGLFGTLPEELGVTLQSSLQQFNMTGNLLTGSIPISYGLLSQLTHFDVRHNSLKSNILPLEWANNYHQLQQLEELCLDHNLLSGSIDDDGVEGILSTMTNLKVLGLSNLDTLHGSLNVFGQQTLPQLKELYVHDNSLTGTIPTTMSKHLTILDLGSNQLTGTIPENFYTLYPSLEQVFVSDNYLTGRLPFPTTTATTNITHIDAIGNLLDDSWQEYETFGPLGDTLEHLTMSRLSGTLPNAMGELTQLKVLAIDQSVDLSGTLPMSIVNWTQLEMFWLDGTGLSGNLPVTAIESWKKLQHLRISGNLYFNGTLPPELSRLGYLGQVTSCANEGSPGNLDHIFCSSDGKLFPRFKFVSYDDCTCCDDCEG